MAPPPLNTGRVNDPSPSRSDLTAEAKLIISETKIDILTLLFLQPFNLNDQ